MNKEEIKEQPKEKNVKQEDKVEEKEIKKDNKKEESKTKQEKKKFFNKNNKEIEELKKEVSTLKESLLRNQAELQNYKRRKDEELIKELLPIIDNFERAIKMDDDDLTDEVSKFLEGFKIIYTNTISTLEKFKVQEIQADGVEFDPTYHHAVLTDHNESKPAGVVLEVLQKGYIYKDRVIRPAMVKVNE